MQNNYDNFAEQRAAEFAANTNLFHAYIEKPAMLSVMPEVNSFDILCVGCGTGEECLDLYQGGANVSGFDASELSVKYAKEHLPEEIDLRVGDMDDPDFGGYEASSFDLVYSSMTLHYSNDLAGVLRSAHHVLRPRGSLLFSVGHPVRWATEISDNGDDRTVLLGYTASEDKLTLYGNYLEKRQYTQQLHDGPEVTYWMRPPSDYFRLLKWSGFVVEDFIEPKPVDKAKEVREQFWELRKAMPSCMIFFARKSGGSF